MKRLLALALISCCPAFCGYTGYVLFQTVPSKAGSSSTAPYSLLISGTYPSLATVANGGNVVNTVACGVDSITCPADLVFTEDSSCSTLRGGWDIISYSPTTGQLTAAVEIPILSNIIPAKVYGCAGNAAITTFQGGARGAAYDSNYLLALHMEETSGTTLHDSTANADDAIKKGSGNPSPTPTGQVGAAQSFLGTENSVNNDYALFSSPTALANTYTIEYWTDVLSHLDEDSVFLESSSGSPTVFMGFLWYPVGVAIFKNSWNSFTPSAPANFVAGTFHYVVYVRDGDSINIFVDGVPGTPQSGLGTGQERWKGLGWDGGANFVVNSFNGILDEVFYSNVARSPDYVTARFNNISSPSTFYTASPFTMATPILPSTTHANSQVNIFVF